MLQHSLRDERPELCARTGRDVGLDASGAQLVQDRFRQAIDAGFLTAISRWSVVSSDSRGAH
ncbi:MAG: hypothetical protein Ct9H300mP14_16190 [Gammaproteobacteria bacterium]|nr:MAG: hypothetical protein Ct9H300mP14_16190 [Gammaproteobacteria bacterium]